MSYFGQNFVILSKNYGFGYATPLFGQQKKLVKKLSDFD